MSADDLLGKRLSERADSYSLLQLNLILTNPDYASSQKRVVEQEIQLHALAELGISATRDRLRGVLQIQDIGQILADYGISQVDYTKKYRSVLEQRLEQDPIARLLLTL